MNQDDKMEREQLRLKLRALIEETEAELIELFESEMPGSLGDGSAYRTTDAVFKYAPLTSLAAALDAMQGILFDVKKRILDRKLGR